MKRITRYALALALGFSVVSPAAFAADQSQDQSPLIQTANAQYASQQRQGATAMPGPYRFQLEQGRYAQVGPYDRPSQYLGGI